MQLAWERPTVRGRNSSFGFGTLLEEMNIPKHHDNLRLHDQLCFALYAATHAITRSYKGALGAVGLTYPQYLVMLVLWEADGRAVGSIASALDLDAATLTPLVKRLEQAGFVMRERRCTDERVIEVRLTAAGRDLQDVVARIQEDVACRTKLSNDDFTHLRRTLHCLAQSLVETTERAPIQTGSG